MGHSIHSKCNKLNALLGNQKNIYENSSWLNASIGRDGFRLRLRWWDASDAWLRGSVGPLA